MKVNSINKGLCVQNKQSFTGFDIKKDDYGDKIYNFSYPYDSSRYDCYLKLVSVIPDQNGNYKIGDTLQNYENDVERLKLNPGNNFVDIQSAYRLAEKEPFAYQYQLQPKYNPQAVPMFRVEAGDILDERYSSGGHQIYNLVVPSGAVSNDAGAAILICTDNYDVRWVYNKDGKIVSNSEANIQRGLNTSKDFANEIGGTAAGLEHAIDTGELDAYSKIFLLPFATGDRTSQHYYWLESGFQLSGAIDDMQTYARIQQKLFAKGKNMVSDAAVTSEGLSGIHFQSILHYGEDNVFYDWFKCSSLQDMCFKIGTFGKKTKFIRHKLVNAPFIPVQNEHGKIILKTNHNYNKKEPTYVQIYNIHNASDSQMEDGSPLIRGYEKPASGEKVLNNGTHNDTVFTYAFPIDPEDYKKNVELLNEYNRKLPQKMSKVLLNSYEATRMLTKFEYYEFENKFEGGFYTWDANVDMAKFNYSFSNTDVQDSMHLPIEDRNSVMRHLREKNCEVMDYAVSSVRYWTKKTSQILNLYTAQALKKIDEEDPDKALNMIKQQISNNILPKKLAYEINRDIISNVQDGSYTLHGMDSVENIHDTILAGLMDFPLESAELGKDILSLLSTPYITKRATHPDEIGKSRMEMFTRKNPHLKPEYENIYNRTDRLYSDILYPFAKEVLTDVNKRLPKEQRLNRYDDTSPYGKYVLPILTQEIMKFALMKGLLPDLKYRIDSQNGGIIYDYKTSRQSSLKSIGITSISQKRDADKLVTKMGAGIKQISESDKKKLADALYKMIEDTNLTSFKMAEMIVDRAKGGLDFRFDAAKDVSNMDSLRNYKDTFEDNWSQVISFWKQAADAIYEENPNSYIVAEITDENDLYNKGAGGTFNKYACNDLIRKFLRETGITAIANYNWFFTDIAGIFGKLGENGQDRGMEQGYRVHNILKKGHNGGEFLFSGPYESILKSYTFIDNHDKPRILQILSMDMGFFYADLNDITQSDYRRRAYAILHPDIGLPNDVTDEQINEFDFSYISAKAAARAEALNTAFYHALKQLNESKDNNGNPIISSKLKDALLQREKQVTAELVSGSLGNGQVFETDNFGVEEFHKIIDIVANRLAIATQNVPTAEQLDALKATVFEKALDPAISKALAIDKFLINLPGIPTTYAGDDLASTGYETKTKNIYLKNRAAVHHNWADKFPFVKRHKENEENLKLLRSRPAVHALNNGAPFLLPLQYGNGKQISALLRYAPDGNAVISLFNTAGADFTYDKYTDASKSPVYLDKNRINLSRADDFTGLHGGLTPGMEFLNICNENDKYEIVQEGGADDYYLVHKDRSPIKLTDNTLTLYHASNELKEQDRKFMEKVQKQREADPRVSFCGNRKILYNPQYNIAPALYRKQTDTKIGEKLVLVCS